MLVCGSAEDELRCSTADRHRIDVADNVEGNRLSIRRDVEIDPCSFGYVIVDIPGGAVLGHDIPLCRISGARRRGSDSGWRIDWRRGRILSCERQGDSYCRDERDLDHSKGVEGKLAGPRNCLLAAQFVRALVV